VRIYIDSNPEEKKVKGGFAVGGYDLTKGITGDYFNVSGRSDAETIAGEARVLWYPAKEAFRSGNVIIESKDSVGTNSWASGYQSKAIGNYSQAMGYQAVARKDYSTAIGKNAVASEINSFAFGEDARAKNAESYAIGRGALAEGFRSFAFGSAGADSVGGVTGVAYAQGDYSFAIGQGSQSLGRGAFAIGLADTARGDYSVALGYETTADRGFSTAMGFRTLAGAYHSTALGAYTRATANSSTAMGYSTIAQAEYSTAMGFLSRTYGIYSTAFGCWTEASGSSAVAGGNSTLASGYASTAFGSSTTASGSSSTAMGSGTTASGNYSAAIGSNISSYSGYETVTGRYNTIYTPVSTTGWNSSDRLFVVGNGTGSSVRSNALTVLKNGRIGLQTITAPIYALELPNSNIVGIGYARAYAWATYSDARVKSYETHLSYGLKEIMQLMPAEYFHHGTLYDNDQIVIQKEGKNDIGLIAQDVYSIIPEAVNKPEDDSKDLWSISYDKLIPVLINAVKEQQLQIEAQQQQIDELKAMAEKLMMNQED
jgi:hypothetical protein